MRNDSPCGSTIGPIMSAKLGIPTIDVGAPQWSMHSIRETGDTSSVHQSLQLFTVSRHECSLLLPACIAFVSIVECLFKETDETCM